MLMQEFQDWFDQEEARECREWVAMESADKESLQLREKKPESKKPESKKPEWVDILGIFSESTESDDEDGGEPTNTAPPVGSDPNHESPEPELPDWEMDPAAPRSPRL